MTSKHVRWKFLAAIALVVILLDQWTKLLAVEHLTPGLANAVLAEKAARDGVKPRAIERYAEREEVLADVGFAEKLGLFYREVRNPCRRRGSLCPEIEVIDGFWSWRYAENTGAAWSILSGRRYVLLGVTLLAIGFIVSFVRKLEDGQRVLLIALSLVLGGALGNLIDRIYLGYVVDFILWYRGQFYWPTFNVADSAISTGVGLILLSSLLEIVQKRRAPVLAGEGKG